ncbi:MAG: phospholipase D-like domain-containing protein [Spirochaetes bacterium]|jgi:phosphatidylserine/phosphatidylglycerophosphate/cardiolipin synthase-like enzyme|nr:phospholipase D-like domain-containing protein [Spirochaetota bacterium]
MKIFPFRLAAAAAAFLFACTSIPAGKTGWWSVYFTRPDDPRLCAVQGPRTALVRAIDSAASSLSGAFFQINSREITEALVRAKKRGVDVRIVTDGDYYDSPMISRLISEQIEVVPDKRRAFMHNKFAVIDGEAVWTGSFNATDNCSMKNDNNAIMVRSAELAAIYLDEFDEMFRARIFGNRKNPGPFPWLGSRYHVNIEGTDINCYFAPEDDVERIILKRLAKARTSIHFMAFSFTSNAIGEMMIRKYREGVRVAGVFEKRGSGSRMCQYRKMVLEGLPVRLDRNIHAMHHKVIVIDGERVITGSYNFTRNADRKNDENILIIDNREIAAEYLKEFGRLYGR